PSQEGCYRAVRFIAFIPTVLLFSACAPTTQRVSIDPKLAEAEAEKQREIALSEFHKEKRRLFYVSYPLLIGGRALCKDKVSPHVGASFSSAQGYPEEFRSAARTVFGETDAFRISLVAPNSPADAAGLREGDILLRLDGQPVPKGEAATEKLVKLYEEIAKKKSTFTLDVRRGEQELQLTITSVMGCDYPVVLSTDDSLNAYADGERVVIMRGMLRFASSDTELSVVIAHELAHNVMQHISAKRGNAMLGMLADILAGVGGVNTQGTFTQMAANAYSQDFEAEADYVGLYIMALSGVGIDGAAYFWRRMAAAHPQAIQSGGFLATHPSTPERFLGLENTIVEIKQKQTAGKPLRPELKK
ncbi:MAG: M48 family metalloprotease, partial [Alphaproteobacteria bacterium]|nr:M48 family metalloprotease [Alphaproteobacteria bacterium]